MPYEDNQNRIRVEMIGSPFYFLETDDFARVCLDRIGRVVCHPILGNMIPEEIHIAPEDPVSIKKIVVSGSSHPKNRYRSI